MAEKDVYVIADEDIELPFRSILGGEEKKKKTSRSRAPDWEETFPGAGRGRPRMAATLSLWISGAGQFLHGEWKIGTLYLLVLGFVASIHYFLHSAWDSLVVWVRAVGVRESDLLIGVVLMDLYLAMVLLSGVYNAYRIGRHHSGPGSDPAPHPLLAACASLVIPGWGQIVNGQIRKAMVFLFLFFTEILAVGVWLCLREPVERLFLEGGEPMRVLLVGSCFAGYGLLGWSLSLYDAALVARYRKNPLL